MDVVGFACVTLAPIHPISIQFELNSYTAPNADIVGTIRGYHCMRYVVVFAVSMIGWRRQVYQFLPGRSRCCLGATVPALHSMTLRDTCALLCPRIISSKD